MSNISPLNVEIKTISLNGKKMTKSLFGQIETVSCFTRDMDFLGDELFGYIIDKNNKYLLWQRNGLLRKTNLLPYYRWLQSGDPHPTLELITLFKDHGLTYDYPDHRRSKFEECISNIEKYKELTGKISAFLQQIRGQQIYI